MQQERPAPPPKKERKNLTRVIQYLVPTLPIYENCFAGWSALPILLSHMPFPEPLLKLFPSPCPLKYCLCSACSSLLIHQVPTQAPASPITSADHPAHSSVSFWKTPKALRVYKLKHLAWELLMFVKNESLSCLANQFLNSVEPKKHRVILSQP